MGEEEVRVVVQPQVNWDTPSSEQDDLFWNHSNLFFQRLDSEEVIYKVKKEKYKFIGDYIMGELLGEGSYGKVKEVLHSQTLHRRAVKILKKRKLRRIPNGEANVEREIRLLQRLDHPRIIKLIDVLFNKEKQKMYIVLEYCLTGLHDVLLLAKFNKFPHHQAHRYFVQVIEGLEYLHSKGIIHKDIKPGNLLLSLDETIKITDFGVAEALDPYAPTDTCTTSQGSPVFQPPQVANGEPFSGYKLDVWSTGVTLYNLTTGLYPFDGDTVFLLFENIARGVFTIPSEVDAPLAALLTGMLQTEEHTRFSIQDIKTQPWFLKRPPFNTDAPMVKVPPERRQLSVTPFINSFLQDQLEQEYLEEQHNFIPEKGEVSVVPSTFLRRSMQTVRKLPNHLCRQT